MPLTLQPNPQSKSGYRGSVPNETGSRHGGLDEDKMESSDKKADKRNVRDENRGAKRHVKVSDD